MTTGLSDKQLQEAYGTDVSDEDRAFIASSRTRIPDLFSENREQKRSTQKLG